MQETGPEKPPSDNGSVANSNPGQGAAPGTTPPPSSAPSGGAGNFIMGTINSAIALVKNPASYMAANKDAPATVNDIMIKYVAVLAAIPFFAILIGDLWYYSIFSIFGFAGSFIAYAFVAAILTYILDVVGVYVMGIVIRFLAPTFGSTVDEMKSLKLAAFIYTPAFLAGIFNIIPLLGIIALLGLLYGIYILYIGLPIMLGTPKDKAVTYTIAVLVAVFVIYVIFAAIIGAITAAIFLTRFGFL